MHYDKEYKQQNTLREKKKIIIDPTLLGHVEMNVGHGYIGVMVKS